MHATILSSPASLANNKSGPRPLSQGRGPVELVRFRAPHLPKSTFPFNQHLKLISDVLLLNYTALISAQEAAAGIALASSQLVTLDSI
jgi:hypothetical protein